MPETEKRKISQILNENGENCLCVVDRFLSTVHFIENKFVKGFIEITFFISAYF